MLDKLSEFLMVEQGGLKLYRVVAARCTDPALRQRYEEFGQETANHREVLIRLIEQLGGNPSHISPTARLAQVKSDALLETALKVDGLTQTEIELNDLENVLLAETKDHADWSLLQQLATQIPAGETKDALTAAVNEVEAEEDEHLTWARETLTQRCLELALNGPTPDPMRIHLTTTGATLPIEAVHPAPMPPEAGFLEGASLPVWEDSVVVRATSGTRAGGDSLAGPARESGAARGA
jgi:rubrerythrin